VDGFVHSLFFILVIRDLKPELYDGFADTNDTNTNDTNTNEMIQEERHG